MVSQKVQTFTVDGNVAGYTFKFRREPNDDEKADLPFNFFMGIDVHGLRDPGKKMQADLDELPAADQFTIIGLGTVKAPSSLSLLKTKTRDGKWCRDHLYDFSISTPVSTFDELLKIVRKEAEANLVQLFVEKKVATSDVTVDWTELDCLVAGKLVENATDGAVAQMKELMDAWRAIFEKHYPVST